MNIEKDIKEAVTKYSDMLYKICLVILCNEQDVQDAIQDTFCKYLEKKPVFHDEEHEKAWLIKVATNICRDMIRFRVRHPKVPIDKVENILVAPEQRQTLKELLELPVKHKTVIYLHYVEGYDVKEVMDQVHISAEMQEEIIMNIQKRMENENKKAGRWNWKKMTVAAAAFILAAGAASFPVRAFVTSLVKERMESIPREEVQEINDMVQSKPTEADVFSREYSEGEEERNKELWQAYKEGKFPENVIMQVDNEEDAPEGALCYIRSVGVFQLPAQEMTDEEILEIIDFQHKMSYAVSQGTAAQEARAERAAEEKQWREKIQDAGGISEEEAIEIAEKQMKDELGERAEGKEILKYEDGSAAVIKIDISEQTDYEHKGDVAYLVIFSNPSENDHSTYYCMIDTVDGSICGAYSLSGDLGPYWDIDDFVWYEH